MDPRRRRALCVTVEDEEKCDQVLNDLMGKDPKARFRFITERGAEAELDV